MKRARVFMVKIGKLILDSEQEKHRFEESDLKIFAHAIKQGGPILPVLVKKHGTKYQVVHGVRRYRAAVAAGRAHVCVEVVK